MSTETGQPLDLILARNLISTMQVPAFLVDVEGTLLFYNVPAGELLGRRFEETGSLRRDEWREIGPLDASGNPLPDVQLPLTTTLREGRPAHERFIVCADDRSLIEIEASALPLASPDALHGAIVVFWPSAAG